MFQELGAGGEFGTINRKRENNKKWTDPDIAGNADDDFADDVDDDDALGKRTSERHCEIPRTHWVLPHTLHNWQVTLSDGEMGPSWI